MQYTLNIFKKAGIPYSWNTIYIGRKIDLLYFEEVMNYAIEFLLAHPEIINPYIAELASGTQENLTDEMLTKALLTMEYELPRKDCPIWNLEKRKWQYCILWLLKNTLSNPVELLDAIRLVYKDFGCPSDMKNITCSLSTTSTSSKKRVLQAINLFNQFLISEKQHLTH